MSKIQTTPWVEKYRPITFDNIVLEKYNKIFLQNIISNDSFPNLLLYGPPGTGKTTTIINLIQSYQVKHNCDDKSLIIHLNASDERGIDTIRNNINSFVNSKSLFKKGMKFVILDEVDYMTKNAQQALKHLLHSHPENVRFCLICNYISKIDESLQNDFARMRFNQLPKTCIIEFLNNISQDEGLYYTRGQLESIQNLFNSDMRSMINYMQSNQHVSIKHEIINNSIWDNIINKCKTDPIMAIKEVNIISKSYNIEVKNILKNVMNYIIRHHKCLVNNTFLNMCKNITHSQDSKIEHILNYFFAELHFLLAV
jgi:DNA polymerase III delta prime subunit